MEHQPEPSAELVALLHSCSDGLPPISTDDLRSAFEPAYFNAEPSPQHLQMVYDTACKLCDDGNFHFASGLALHLATQKAADPRFTFLAGTCLQRLGIYANAARFFCISLIHGGESAGALYRLGECLVALGQREHAERVLDAAFEASRDVEDGSQIQTFASDLMDSLKRGPGRA